MRVCPKVFIYYRPISLYSLLIITVVSILAGYNHVSNLLAYRQSRHKTTSLYPAVQFPAPSPRASFRLPVRWLSGRRWLPLPDYRKQSHLIGEQIRTVKEQRYRLLLFRETYSRKKFRQASASQFHVLPPLFVAPNTNRIIHFFKVKGEKVKIESLPFHFQFSPFN